MQAVIYALGLGLGPRPIGLPGIFVNSGSEGQCPVHMLDFHNTFKLCYCLLSQRCNMSLVGFSI